MTIPTVTVIGTAVPPDDVSVGGTIRFVLSGFDTDGDNSVIVPREVSGAIANDGAFSVPLWPTTRGLNGRTYTAYVSLPRPSPGAGNSETAYGPFSLTDGADIQTLAEILTAPAPSARDELTLTAWLAAADTANGAGRAFESIAAGLAGSTNGQYFLVLNAADVRMYLNTAGAAVASVVVA